MELECIHLFGERLLLSFFMEEIKMGKVEILRKRKKSKKKFLKEHVPFTSKELKNSKLIVDTLLECIRIGDLDSFREVLAAHVMTINKVKFVQKAGISRRTLYTLIDPRKGFNPELSTISSIIQSLAA